MEILLQYEIGQAISIKRCAASRPRVFFDLAFFGVGLIRKASVSHDYLHFESLLVGELFPLRSIDITGIYFPAASRFLLLRVKYVRSVFPFQSRVTGTGALLRRESVPSRSLGTVSPFITGILVTAARP